VEKRSLISLPTAETEKNLYRKIGSCALADNFIPSEMINIFLFGWENIPYVALLFFVTRAQRKYRKKNKRAEIYF